MARGPEIKNPRFEQIEAGMMVRAKYGRNKNYGAVIGALRPETQEVLVGEYLGGKMECWVWIPIKDINVVWSIGTYEYAMDLIGQFNGAMTNQAKAAQKAIEG